MAFNPPPTDGSNHCGNCAPNTCFIYSGGAACQPYIAPVAYPPLDANTTVVSPPQWYIASRYPSLRYTGSLTNQTNGAACTTVPIPPRSLFNAVARQVLTFDMGSIWTAFDITFPSTLLQYRGNCAEGFFCQPNTLPSTSPIDLEGRGNVVQGELPGTCRPEVEIGQACYSSTMCKGWQYQVSPRVRCKDTNDTARSGNPQGICSDELDESRMTLTARNYLLSALLVLMAVFLYMWYRRMKHRRRMAMLMQNGHLNYYDNGGTYVPRGGVYRPPDDNDNGELPSYGNHRRDERVTGPAAEEIGMYSFSSGGPPPPALTPLTTPPHAAFPPNGQTTQFRPVQQSYPFPMTHPAFSSAGPGPLGPLYPPPASPPPPTLSATEAAALSAAAAAAGSSVTAPAVSAQHLDQGGFLPPAYDSSLTSTVPPAANAITKGEKTEMIRGDPTTEEPASSEEKENQAGDHQSTRSLTSSTLSAPNSAAGPSTSPSVSDSAAAPHPPTSSAL